MIMIKSGFEQRAGSTLPYTKITVNNSLELFYFGVIHNVILLQSIICCVVAYFILHTSYLFLLCLAFLHPNYSCLTILLCIVLLVGVVTLHLDKTIFTVGVVPMLLLLHTLYLTIAYKDSCGKGSSYSMHKMKVSTHSSCDVHVGPHNF